MKLTQFYTHYETWEDYHFGMWRNISESERKILLPKAIEFTGNAKLYGKYMKKVVKEWPYSCAMNLSNISMNRQAWIGHAACCLALGCPEDVTRQAWHYLTQKQQDDANLQADYAIELWEKKYIKGYQPCLKLA